MLSRDWTDPAAYAFTAGLDAAQWAWEFLRRNPDYQREWTDFSTVWQALEAEYGRPPVRDFTAWKRDPRAWVSATDCPEGDCRVDQDKVLIECAVGARWGFYKFPPDPADDDPVGAGRLVWREVDDEVVMVGPADADWLGADPSKVALGFDLALPLRAQVERAKRQLQLLRRQRERGGEVEARSVTTLHRTLTTMLRLLDATAAGAGGAQLATLDADWQGGLNEALELRDAGYRRLAWLPR